MPKIKSNPPKTKSNQIKPVKGGTVGSLARHIATNPLNLPKGQPKTKKKGK